jgi:hypothetical protein
MVGCNTYLTPKGAQGFAPHYDDIEVRIIHGWRDALVVVTIVATYHNLSRTRSSLLPGLHSAAGGGKALACIQQPNRRAATAHVISYDPQPHLNQSVLLINTDKCRQL